MNRKEDHYYINKILEGDIQTFGVLVDRYKPMIFTLALRIIKNREDAEEVAQDTFLKAYKALDTFQGTSKFSTWIYKIAYNSSLDCLKKKKLRADINSIDVTTLYDLKTMGGILEDMDRNDRKLIIREAIDQLSSEDSAIILLYYYEELSVKEIAPIVGLSPQVLKVRLFRSRKQLALILNSKIEPEIIGSYEK
jgi:RNA polymerase sigma-70 factor (ECF subfamily)